MSDWMSPIERDMAADEYERLRAINAEMLAALNAITADITGSAELMDNINLKIFEDACTAIAKAEAVS
jgi:hypothetical protein